MEKTGLVDRDKAYVEVLHKTKDPRKATAVYVEGNKWATENAKAVGNL